MFARFDHPWLFCTVGWWNYEKLFGEIVSGIPRNKLFPCHEISCFIWFYSKNLRNLKNLKKISKESFIMMFRGQILILQPALQLVPQKIRHEMLISMEIGFMNGRSPLFFSNELFGKRPSSFYRAVPSRLGFRSAHDSDGEQKRSAFRTLMGRVPLGGNYGEFWNFLPLTSIQVQCVASFSISFWTNIENFLRLNPSTSLGTSTAHVGLELLHDALAQPTWLQLQPLPSSCRSCRCKKINNLTHWHVLHVPQLNDSDQQLDEFDFSTLQKQGLLYFFTGFQGF